MVTGSVLVQLDLLKEAAGAVKDGPGAQVCVGGDWTTFWYHTAKAACVKAG